MTASSTTATATATAPTSGVIFLAAAVAPAMATVTSMAAGTTLRSCKAEKGKESDNLEIHLHVWNRWLVA